MSAPVDHNRGIACEDDASGRRRGGGAFPVGTRTKAGSLRHFGRWLLFLVIVCLAPPAWSANGRPLASGISSSAARDHPQPQFVPLDDDRLNSRSFHSSVYAFHQDSKGFLWLGTHIGLMVYDGYHIDQYVPDAQDQTTISDINISSIAEDAYGGIWAGSMDSGVSRLDRATDTFSHFRNDPEDPHSLSSDDVWCIYRTSSGEMWVGTWGGGLNRYDSDSGRFIRYRSNVKDPDSLSSDIVNAILEDHAGNLWIGTNSGLDRLERSTGRFTHFRNDPHDQSSISDDNVTAIFEDAHQNLWFGTGNGGLNRLHRHRDVFSRYQHSPQASNTISSDKITAILEDEDGSLWIGTIDAGLNRFDPQGETFRPYRHDPSDPHSPRTDGVRALFKDRSGLIWVGLQDGGAFKITYERQRFAHHRLPEANDSTPPGEAVTAIAGNEEQTLWVGTLYGGLLRYDHRSERPRRYRHDPEKPGSLGGDTITALRVGRDGGLWVGTYAGGLDRLDPGGHQFAHYRHDPGQRGSIASQSISALVEDTSGHLWIGTRNKGLDRLLKGGGRFIHYRHDAQNPASLSSDAITALCVGAAGDLWVGTKSKGLNRLDPAIGAVRRYRHRADDPAGLSSDNILTLYQARNGFLWIGTNGGGLNRFDPASGRFASYRQQDGLADETIRAILEDDHGVLWLQSWGGTITKFNPRTGIFTNFGEGSGLQPEQSIIGAAYRSEQGRMYFGAPRGYYAFRPYYNTHVPEIQITDFRLFNQPVTAQDTRQRLRSTAMYTEEIQLGYRDRVFSLAFTALDFTAPERNQYAYRLEGLESEWVFAGPQRTALYANLPPGHYVFRVKGSNNDGIWNEDGASIALVMAPPPWKSWWAYSLYALTASGLFIGYGRYRAHRQAVALKRAQEEAYRAKLEADVAQRTRELVDANSQLTEEIAERKRVEDNLRLSEEKYRRIIETAREGYLLIDENLVITDVNDEFCRMLAFHRRELIGTPLDALGVDEFRHFLEDNRGQLFEDGGLEVKGKLTQKNGPPIPVLLHGSVLHDNVGQPVGNVVFVTDLSVGEMSLALAAEVQQSLLNHAEPRIAGLDLAGRSKPCADVGGDYFDLIPMPAVSGKSLMAVVGDISGHGVEAALLMTAARSFLRMRAGQGGSLADIVADLNRHLFKDVSQTFRFMTFFILALDGPKAGLEWVRAGHDPALLYDPADDRFHELKGMGIALGLEESFPFVSYRRDGFRKGQLVVMASDGITETRSTAGEMFGRDRLRQVIRASARFSAGAIVDRIFDAVATFTRGTLPDDDRTLVVVKRT